MYFPALSSWSVLIYLEGVSAGEKLVRGIYIA